MKKTEFDYLSGNYDEALKKSFPTALEEVNYFSTYKIKLVHDLTKNKKNINILDFGCGAGTSLSIFSKYFKSSKLWGYDVSNEFIKKIKKRKKNIKLTTNLKKIPKKKFDLIFISNVLGGIEKQNIIKIKDFLIRKLNKGGTLFLTEHVSKNQKKF